MGLFDRFRTPDAAKMAAAGDVDGLIQALGHKKAVVVEAAVRGLGQLKTRRAVDPKTPREKARAAINVIANIPSTRCVPRSRTC